jgi:hypothetical protein
MLSAFLSLVVWGVRPTICGPAIRTPNRNPRLLREANAFAGFIASHIG